MVEEALKNLQDKVTNLEVDIADALGLNPLQVNVDICVHGVDNTQLIKSIADTGYLKMERNGVKWYFKGDIIFFIKENKDE